MKTQKMALAVAMLLPLLPIRATAEEQVAQIGRYQIINSPLGARFTYLLDTVTGRVWQLAKYPDIKGEPELWEPMNRFDSTKELVDYLNLLGMKPKQVPAAAPIPPAAQLRARCTGP